MARYDTENKRPPLNEASLRELALTYVGRFATSGARLVRYLERKLRERGWAGDAEADPQALAVRFAELGYIDDASYARMKGASMQRRGLGAGRIKGALAADGIREPDQADALDEARDARWEAADILARRKRIGPYATEKADPALREKHMGVFLRAGHDISTARTWVHADPDEFPERSE